MSLTKASAVAQQPCLDGGCLAQSDVSCSAIAALAVTTKHAVVSSNLETLMAPCEATETYCQVDSVSRIETVVLRIG